MRFLANVPTSQGKSLPVERLFFQIQQAHWFYEDFYVDDLDHIPHMRFRQFIAAMFDHGTLLARYSDRREEFLELFKEYAARIPSCGAIILNKPMTKILMVQPLGGKSWGFPKGKVNEGEADIDCAAREVLEETGVDISSYTKARDFVAYYNGGQLVKLFIVRGIPESIAAAPIARKEIRAVGWHDLSGIPIRSGFKGASKYWSALTVMKQLHAWVQSKGGKVARDHSSRASKPSKKGSRGSGAAAASSSSSYGGHSATTHCLAETFGDDASGEGWSVDAMFRANAKLLGREFRYDGDPHTFGEETAAAAGTSGASSNGAVKPRPGRRAENRYPARLKSLSARGSGVGRQRSGKNSRKGSADTADGDRDHWRGDYAPRGRHSDSLDETFGSGSTVAGGWSVEDMFKRNAEMLGIRFTFDGNPHTFGDATQRHKIVVPPAAATSTALGPSSRNLLTSGNATATASTPASPAVFTELAPAFPAIARLAAFEPDMTRVMAAFDAFLDSAT